MDIKDFLPKYPTVNDVLNPYDDFYESLYKKKEFYENKLDRVEQFPKERGMLTKYQKTITRFLSSRTPYDRLLLVHDPGLGKCVFPTTKIYANGVSLQIADVWNRYKGLIDPDHIGEWSNPITPLTTVSYNENRETITVGYVTKLYRQYINETVQEITTDSNFSISMTLIHRLYTSKGWASEVRPGDKVLVQASGNLFYDTVVTVNKYQYEGWVYDLEVEDYHNYLANSIVTHNTCSAIGAIEQAIEEGSTFTGALIFAKGSQLLDNFIKQLVHRCTAGQYYPSDFKKLTKLEKTRRINKKTQFYQTRTFAKFAKRLKKLSDADIKELYSNKFIVVDEVHNLRIQDEGDPEDIETYKQFHRFLHLVENVKVILMSGTPMKDTPDEIASVCNLLLPMSNQLPTGEKFLEEYMDEKGGVYTVKKSRIEDLKSKFKGIVSVLKEAESTVPKEFIGKENYKELKHFIVAPFKMSKFQTKYYESALEKDKSGKTGVYISSREASLFVYPDGSYGQQGFKKYIITGKEESSYSLSPELKSALKGDSDEETLKNIAKHSVTYANVIKNILETKGNCFVYSSLVQGSGAILFSLLLDLFGYSKAKGTETTMAPRYAILTNKTSSPAEIGKVNELFNSPGNFKGSYIKVIIGSRAISEGFSFANVVFESINTPHWNYSETIQAIARGIRLGSHNTLLEAGEKPVVKILQPVAVPANPIVDSIDYIMYKTSEDKDISIRKILRLLMESAFDCALNYLRNRAEGKDGSRECDYTTCDYKCDGISPDLLGYALDDEELDYSTYQLYYANPKVTQIRSRMEKLFRENIKLDLDSIIENLKKEFTEEEIRNALFIIQEESQGKDMDYKKFLDIYSRSPVKKIINKVEELFRDHFRLDLDTLLEQLRDYREFEVLTALSMAIEDNIPITNKYGYTSYLREENNIYFLVNSLSVEADFYTEYYSKYPHATVPKTHNDISREVYKKSIPKIVKAICNTTDKKEFSKLVKTLPEPVQNFFIEASIVAGDSSTTAVQILELFKSYVKNIDGTWISSFLQEKQGILRCLEEGGVIDDWRDCESKYSKLFVRREVERKEKLKEENPYGIMGKYNPQNGSFCILDFEKEKEAIAKIGQKREGVEGDKRLSHSGKVCGAGGWKLPELMSIVVRRLKIDPPENFRKLDTVDGMIKDIKDDKTVSETFKEELKQRDKNILRRILYFSTSKKEGGSKGIKPICEVLKTWFEEKGLLEVDNMCGVQGKKKVSIDDEEEKKTVKREFRIEPIVPRENEERFKAYTKDIVKVLQECFDEKRKIPIDNKLWVLAFARKKLVGAVSIDQENELSNVCIAKNYRRQGIGKDAMSDIMNYLKDRNPILKVDNRSTNAKKDIRTYTGYGFSISRTEDRYTYLEFK